MKTIDFSGTYDYELEEAQYAANYLLEDLADGYCSLEEFYIKVERERIHWKKCIPDTFDEFDKYFTEEIKKGLESFRGVDDASA